MLGVKGKTKMAEDVKQPVLVFVRSYCRRNVTIGGSKILVTGHWSLVAGHWSLVAGRWSLVAGHWSLVAGHWSLVKCPLLVLTTDAEHEA